MHRLLLKLSLTPTRVLILEDDSKNRVEWIMI